MQMASQARAHGTGVPGRAGVALVALFPLPRFNVRDKKEMSPLILGPGRRVSSMRPRADRFSARGVMRMAWPSSPGGCSRSLPEGMHALFARRHPATRIGRTTVDKGAPRRRGFFPGSSQQPGGHPSRPSGAFGVAVSFRHFFCWLQEEHCLDKPARRTSP